MVYGGGLGWRQKTMKTIFRMNGLFQGACEERERERERKWNKKKETRETARERSAT